MVGVSRGPQLFYPGPPLVGWSGSGPMSVTTFHLLKYLLQTVSLRLSLIVKYSKLKALFNWGPPIVLKSVTVSSADWCTLHKSRPCDATTSPSPLVSLRLTQPSHTNGTRTGAARGNGNFTLPFKQPTPSLQCQWGQTLPRGGGWNSPFFKKKQQQKKTGVSQGTVTFPFVLLHAVHSCASRDMKTLRARLIPSHSLAVHERPRWLNVLFNGRGM